MTTCWKCADSDAAYQAKCTAPACGMRETAEPSVSPENADAEENVRLDAELQRCMEERDVLRTELAALRAAPSTSPLNDEIMWKLWNAQGVDEMNQPEAIAFGRAVEAAHGIALPLPAK